jgi:hypothetical protein
MGEPPVAVEMACRRIISQTSARDRTNKIFLRDLGNSKNMIFNVKKLLNDGVDLTLRQGGEKKQA